jgi:carbonic anhydrase
MQRRSLCKFLLVEAIALKCLNISKAQASTWSYQGETGTDFWGELDPKFQTYGQVYELLQFHFHQPSEHLISGKAAEMEAHFVHQNQATGDLVVLAVLMSEGEMSQALESIWQQIPRSDAQTSQVSDLTINALQLLPENSRQYYRYQGSLTTPPCSEIVTWLVLKQPVSVSKAQLTRFFQAIGNNARPVQALNQRSLLQFN